MKALTNRQQEVLDLIRQAIDNTGRPPTRAEIAQQLGFRSANAAEDHLQALAKKGAIILDASTSRGIRLAGEFAEAFEKATLRTIDNLLNLPLVGRVAAGSPILAQEHVEASYPVDAALFSDKPDYLLKVRGMSMRDIGILDGDLLAVKRTANAWHGQIVVARVNDNVTVKRYFKQSGRIELLPENSDFKPIIISPEDNFAIEGLAVGLVRVGQLG
jgi:repressor LexA